MDVFVTRGAGLDVHKKNVVACRLLGEAGATPEEDTCSFGPTTAEVLRLSDWLSAAGVTHVVLESTGVYWKPLFNLREGSCALWIVNAAHVKNVPGRKTDVNDAQWLASLLRLGLLRPSFIPPPAQRDVRDLTRERTNFVRQRATLVNRVQKVLEAANIKLGDVASDVLGVSGRAMRAALIAGETRGPILAGLAKGRLRNKRAELEAALEGRVRPHHRFLLTELLCQIDSLEETIGHFEDQIAQACAADEEVIALLDTIPVVNRQVAQVLVAELGTDMTRFPTAGHAAAWAGVAPSNNESAGKRRPSRVREGNGWLRVALIQAAHGASHSKGGYLAAQYHRLAAKRGKKRALVAVAHSILVIAYHVIQRKEPYQELGGEYFEKRNATATTKRLVRQAERLGYQVTLTPVAAAS